VGCAGSAGLAKSVVISPFRCAGNYGLELLRFPPKRNSRARRDECDDDDDDDDAIFLNLF
jgi:hypothetical protein